MSWFMNYIDRKLSLYNIYYVDTKYKQGNKNCNVLNNT